MPVPDHEFYAVRDECERFRAENERLRADVTELAELRRLALDGRISFEILGMRIRNTIAAARTHQQTASPTEVK